MTFQELQQLSYLEKLIKIQSDRLEDLRATVGLKSPALSDMPRAPGAKDKLGEVVPAIADQAVELEKSIEECQELRERILRFINAAPNARIKSILMLRYIDQRSWEEVATVLGGKETEASVRMCIARYIDQSAE